MFITVRYLDVLHYRLIFITLSRCISLSGVITLYVVTDAPSLQEVRDAVGKLNSGKAAGCCCINAEMLKHGGEVMLE